MNSLEMLEAIWQSSFFAKGINSFSLYNFGLFRIVNKEEYGDWNSEPRHLGKKILAVSDNNGDSEHYAYLYFDEESGEIFVETYYPWDKKRPLKKVSNSLEELLGNTNFESILIKARDEDFWNWLEGCYFSYIEEINSEVPKGVLPSIDLRYYFQNKPGCFLFSGKERRTDELEEYLQSFGIKAISSTDYLKGVIENSDFQEFVLALNKQLGKDVFSGVQFIEVDYWGISNKEQLSESDIEEMSRYGLIAN